MGLLKTMYNFIKSSIRWITRVDTIEDICKWLNVSKVLFGASRNKKILKFIYKVQEELNQITGKVTNEEVENIVSIVNKNEKGFYGIYATIRKDKHGKGNHGIDLKLDTDIVDISWDPTDGEIKFGI